MANLHLYWVGMTVKGSIRNGIKRDEAERRRRGWARAYDPHVALRQVTDAFWKAGYSATSLDDIAAATGMNRPSLYGVL
jgi:hypothetical protein